MMGWEGSLLRLTRVVDGDKFFALMDAVLDDTHRAQWGPGFTRVGTRFSWRGPLRGAPFHAPGHRDRDVGTRMEEMGNHKHEETAMHRF